MHLISGDLWAGAEVMAFNLIRNQMRIAELDVSATLLNEGRLADALRAVGVEVRILDERRLSFPAIMRYARRHLWEKLPRIIHSHRYKENIIAALAGGRRLGAQLIATQHGMAEPLADGLSMAGRVAAWLNRWVLSRRFDRLVVVSKEMRCHYISQLGFQSEKVVTIHNGIDLPGKCAEKLIIRRGELAVGSAGRFFPVKDYLLMARIARELAGGGDFRFLLAGDGPERPAIERFVADYSLGNCFAFRGEVTQMATFYAELDIYMNTSLHEGIPMSILEAMSHGLPVVAPKVGGIVEIITDGVDGFLIPSRDPRDFAEKLILLGRDPIMRRRMGMAARRKIEKHFSAEAMAGRYDRMYREMVFGPNADRGAN